MFDKLVVHSESSRLKIKVRVHRRLLRKTLFIEVFCVFADLCCERIPRELYNGSQRRLAPAPQTPPVIHFQRLDARSILHRRRQLLSHSAASADRRSLLSNAESESPDKAPAECGPPTEGKRVIYVHAIKDDGAGSLPRPAQFFILSLIWYRNIYSHDTSLCLFHSVVSVELFAVSSTIYYYIIV